MKFNTYFHPSISQSIHITMLGNILLILTALFYVGLLSITSSPMPGGDRGVGYAFVMFICGAGFIVLTGLLAWNLSANNHFDWVKAPGGHRNWLIFIGWLAFTSATFFSAMFKTEWHDGVFPQFLRWLSQAQAAIWLPLLMLVPIFMLLNFQREAGIASSFIQTPMMVGFILSVLMGLGLLFGWFRASARQNADRIEYQQQRDESIHQQHLADIAAFQPSDPLVNILSLTGRYHDPEVRNAAIEKVKSRPDWEAELIRLLNETEWQSQVYQFIDGNEVPHPELFVEPINRSIRRCAEEIRRRITGANDLQDWHFEHFSIERVLRAIDEQFSKVPGADFRPAVRELRAALDTPKPERFNKVQFTTTQIVDDWLKKNR